MKGDLEEIIKNAGQASSEKKRKRALLGRIISIAYLILFFSVGAASGYALFRDPELQLSIKLLLLSLCVAIVSYILFKIIGIARRNFNDQDD